MPGSETPSIWVVGEVCLLLARGGVLSSVLSIFNRYCYGLQITSCCSRLRFLCRRQRRLGSPQASQMGHRRSKCASSLSSCCLIKCWEAERLGPSCDTGIMIIQVFQPGILCQGKSNEALELAHEAPGQTSACQWCGWEGREDQWHLLLTATFS